MNETNILYSKEGLNFEKISKNNYNLNFNVSNKNIILEKIIDINLIKIIYDLNNDIYEKIIIDKLNENESKVVILIKNLFEDLGFSQKFYYVHIKKIEDNNKIIFLSNSLKERPEGIPDDSEKIIIEKMTCECIILNLHEIKFNLYVTLDEKSIIPLFIEKIVSLMIFKIFKRLKQFIEKL
jgi:hypothetical protein